MTSGSAGAVGAAATAAASAGAGSSSTFERDEVDDEHVGLADRLPLRIGRQVAHANAVVQHELGDVDGDVLRNVGRQALDHDVAVHEVDDARPGP